MPSIEGGGVEKNFFIISNHLAKNIKNTKLITADKKYNKFFQNMDIINPVLNSKIFHFRRFKYFFCLIELIKLLFDSKNCLVFSFQANVYAALICKIFKKKIIIRSNSSPSGWKLNIFRKKIFKILLKIPDKIIVNSLQFKNEYKEKFGLKTYCIYNPVDKKIIIQKSKDKIKNNFFKNYKNLKIIFVGRMVDQKDPMTFLKALNLIKNKIKFKAVMIGSGFLEKNLNYFINKNKLSSIVKIYKWQKNPYKYINSADTLILTSEYEGLPNVLLEAIVLKKYIISSNCPTGPKEILDNGKGGDLFKIADYKNLSKKIIFFDKNKNEAIKKIKFATKRLVRFDFNNNLMKYLELIKNEINKI